MIVCLRFQHSRTYDVSCSDGGCLKSDVTKICWNGFSKNLRSYGMLALRALVHCRQAGSEDAMGMLTGQGLHTNLHSTGEILAEGWLKKGDQVLMGIVRDCFCWVRFGFLQTLYRVKPKPNLNEVWRRPNLTPQKQSLSVSKWWVNIALGQTRPPAGLGDFQTYLWLD